MSPTLRLASLLPQISVFLNGTSILIVTAALTALSLIACIAAITLGIVIEALGTAAKAADPRIG